VCAWAGGCACVCKRACDTKAGCSGNAAAISITVHAKTNVCAVKQLTRVVGLVASQRTRTFSRAFAFASRSPSASSLSPTFSKLRFITITTCKSRSMAVVPRCDKRRSHGAFDKRSAELRDNDCQHFKQLGVWQRQLMAHTHRH
jgi:hypothetical protein